MNPKEKRRLIFEDTMHWIESDADLQESVVTSIRNTKIYFEDDYPSFEKAEKNTNITITKERTFEAVQRLIQTYPQAKIAAMNFANAFHPGGGVAHGASAQEECLCRCSTLFPCINTKETLNTYYKHHHDLNTDLASDALIYTPDVTVCKSDTDLPERLEKEDWYEADIITIAAPNLIRDSLSDQALYDLHFKRITHMLTVAAHENVDVLVLGAFGCGAFRNDPYVVANAFHAAIREFPNVFEEITFAIYCSPRDAENYTTFMKTFS